MTDRFRLTYTKNEIVPSKKTIAAHFGKTVSRGLLEKSDFAVSSTDLIPT